ncbi:MAG TPA: sugar phosphate nucleotidyltransferase [Thermoanaerobaculia bacterium]|nr:sugar phosphate nucleotidyltransferase [Thermoanaerobaculia bacterium]
MRSMILAAGLGTRLRPVTNTLPKPMVPVCNRPLIAYAVEAFLAAGIDDIVVNLHHLPDPIVEFLTSTYDCRFEFSLEREILGTGGGIRRVRRFLETTGEFFLVNADTIQFPRYDELRRARASCDAIAALTLRHPPQNDKFTAVYLDHDSITGFGSGTGEALMFSGSHLISSRIFRYLPEEELFGIVEAVYQPLIGRETIAGVVDDGLWFDIGTPQRLITAGHAIRELTIRGDIKLASGSRIEGDSIVDETADIRGTIARSSIGANSAIEGRVSDSAVWDDCHIATAVSLERCIVAHGVNLTESGDFRDLLITSDEAAGVLFTNTHAH